MIEDQLQDEAEQQENSQSAPDQTLAEDQGKSFQETLKDQEQVEEALLEKEEGPITPTPPEKKKKSKALTLAIDIVVFIIFLLVVLYFVFRGSNIEEIGQILLNAAPLPVIGGIICALMFPIIQGRNLKVILKMMGEKITLLDGFKYASTGLFFSCITPSATGGQPMQLLMMSRDKVSVSHSSIALLVEVISYQTATFLLEVMAIVYAFVTKMELPEAIVILCILGMVMNFSFIAFLFCVVFSKKASALILRIGCWAIRHIPKMRPEKKEALIEKAYSAIEEYHECSIVIRQNLKKMANVFLFSMVEAVCWFSTPYAVSVALGVNTESYFVILVMQCFLYMSSALLPFPGAVGISELTFSMIFATMYSEAMMTTAILLNRGMNFYILLVVCGIVMGIGMLKHRESKAMSAKEKRRAAQAEEQTNL